MMKTRIATSLLIWFSFFCHSAKANFFSPALQQEISITVIESTHPRKDFFNKQITIVYLQNLGFEKLSKISNKKNTTWLTDQGYRVIVLDYDKNPNAISPFINQDIIAINDSIAAGHFANLTDCSQYQSYVLCEGYRIARNVPYYIDDPKVYNTPDQYTIGDTLRLDIIYPAKPKHSVPTILSFSYSNSYASYDKNEGKFTARNKNQRLNLNYTFAGFNDTFLAGAPARGMAWAIADHPKYCPWGGGKPEEGPNSGYKSYQENPDAIRKVKSAIRTIRNYADCYNLSNQIGIYGFSRGSDAGSLALGSKNYEAISEYGFHPEQNSEIQVAILGPGVFDFTIIYDVKNDGDNNLESRCPQVWGSLEDKLELWKTKGSSYFITSKDTAPVYFFYNEDDAPYYAEQIKNLRSKLDSYQIQNKLLLNYGTGHAVPQRLEDLELLYDFMSENLGITQE